MEIKFGPDLTYFLWSFLSGFISAFVYDFFRAFRKCKSVSDSIIIIQDIIFISGAFAVMFAEAYFVNAGQMRIYGVITFGVGFIVYRLIVNTKIEFIIVKSFKLLKRIIFYILYPIRFIVRITQKPFFAIIHLTGNAMRKKRKMR